MMITQRMCQSEQCFSGLFQVRKQEQFRIIRLLLFPFGSHLSAHIIYGLILLIVFDAFCLRFLFVPDH